MIDLRGKRFDRVRVLAMTRKHKGSIFWLCECDCGNKKEIAGSSLRGGLTKSCGCRRREVTTKRNTKHGYASESIYSRTYNIWQLMKDRCYNQKSPAYKNYGARGISVCAEWREDFLRFLKDMGQVPDNQEIDRIDNDGNYCKENCRWVRRVTNTRNRRKTVCVVYEGVRLPLAELAEKHGIKYGTLYGRIIKNKWKVDYALKAKLWARARSVK